MRLQRKYILYLSLAIMCLALISYRSEKNVADTPVHQLRIYKVPKQNLKVFHDRFRDHAQRIMKKYGFQIITMWESQTNEKVEFVYLLEWKDKSTMDNAWKNFMADQEWKDIKNETSKLHGTFVESIEDRTLIVTDYSPQKKFLEN